MKKRILFTALCFTFIFAVFAGGKTTFAKSYDKNDNYVLVVKDGQQVIHDKEKDTYIVKAVDTSGNPVSLETYAALLNDGYALNKKLGSKDTKTSQSETIQPLAYYDLSYYTESQNYRGIGDRMKYTTSVDCTKSATDCPITISQGFTVTDSWSANISGGDKNYVKTAVGFSWSTSATSSVSTGLSVPKGTGMYVYFQPYLHVTTGTITYAAMMDGQYQNYGTKDVWGQTPWLLPSGLADGIFGLEIDYNIPQ